MKLTYNFETLKISQPVEGVFHIQLYRPKKRNAINTHMMK